MLTPAVDMFALGVVLTQAAGGAPFGDGPSAARHYKVVYEEPDLTAVPGELRAAIGACLSKDPGHGPHRPPSPVPSPSATRTVAPGCRRRRRSCSRPRNRRCVPPCRTARRTPRRTSRNRTPPPPADWNDGDAPYPHVYEVWINGEARQTVFLHWSAWDWSPSNSRWVDLGEEPDAEYRVKIRAKADGSFTPFTNEVTVAAAAAVAWSAPPKPRGAKSGRRPLSASRHDE
ncbi:hypothetical protein ABZY81_36615 [Streptomyces sp. NPDC006514]|uniref:hypothetical protein n=1 Tax=Streptomyces sp. NPDC006514 TaxID=3154308 RepID=UPI0033BB8502